jgi:hypothetical protein
MTRPRHISDGIRVNLTLPPECVSVLDRIGSFTGAGRATIVRELMLEALPAFAEMARAMELAKAKDPSAYKVMSELLDSTLSAGQKVSQDIKTTRRRAMRRKPIND